MRSGDLTRRTALTPLEEKFVKLGLPSLSDEETIELVLNQSLPQVESRKLARKCVNSFGNLRGLLSASEQELQETGVSPRAIFSIKLLHELPKEVLREKLISRVVFDSPAELFEYLYYSMRDLKIEIFKVVYLNNRNQVIDVTDLFEGTLESIPIRPREIVESAFKSNATALVFVHNHPSGDVNPSKSDKQLTRDLIFIGNVLDIKVLDHIIIGENRYFSFADEGLIQKYSDDFLNIRIRGVFDRKTPVSQ